MSLTIFSILLYLASMLLLLPMWLNTSGTQRTVTTGKKILFFCTALFAIISHLASLLPFLQHFGSGQSFTVMEVGSLISVIIAILATLAILLPINSLWFLMPLIYCFAIINQILAVLMPEHFLYQLNQDISLFFHIGLSLLTYAVCFISALYSIQIFWIDRKLKQKKIPFSPLVPPLMTVERHFFHILLSGEILLSIVLISGSFQLAKTLAPQDMQKAFFSLLAWIVFGLAIWGHWKLHWRGKRMVIYAIVGVMLLSMAYFGSRVMLEI